MKDLATPRPLAPTLAYEVSDLKATRRERKTFPSFSELPAEIRLKIWEYNLPEPNVLTAMYDKSMMRANQPGRAAWVFMNKIKCPFANLHICQESRFEALRSRSLESYKSVHLCRRSERAWFNCNNDTYFINTNVEAKDRILPPDLTPLCAGSLDRVSFLRCVPRDLRFLGISAHMWSWPFEKEPPGLDGMLWEYPNWFGPKNSHKG